MAVASHRICFEEDGFFGVDEEGGEAGDGEGEGAEVDAFLEVVIGVEGGEDGGKEDGLQAGAEVAPHVGPAEELGLVFAADVLEGGPHGGQANVCEEGDEAEGEGHGPGGVGVESEGVAGGGGEFGESHGEHAAEASAVRPGEAIGDDAAEREGGDADGEGGGGDEAGGAVVEVFDLFEVVGEGEDEESPADVVEELDDVGEPEGGAGTGEAKGEAAGGIGGGEEGAATFGEEIDFGGVAAGVEARVVAEDGPVEGGDGEADESIGPTGPTPVAGLEDEVGGEAGGDGAADASAPGDEAAGETSGVDVCPASKQAGAGGVVAGFCEAAAEASEEEGGEAEGKAGGEGEEGPEGDVEGDEDASAEAVAEPACGDLGEGVGPEEAAFDPVDLVGGQVDVFLEGV